MTPTAGQRLAILLGLMGIVAGTGVGLYLAFSSPPHIAHENPGTPTHAFPPAFTPRKPAVETFFHGLQPDLVLVLTGDMHGFLMPCGCARPQTGGLERRFELVERLKARRWPLALADLGNLAPKESTPQNRIKYEISMQVLQDLGYSAIGLGAHEASMPLKDALDVAVSYQPPVILAGNLNDKDARFPGMFQGWTIHNADKNSGGLTVAYVGVVAESVQKQIKPNDPPLFFAPVDAALAEALKQLEERKPTLRVLLFQGTRQEAAAQAFPQFHLILTQGTDEPSALAQRVGPTLVISTGHKGRHVGLAGVFRKRDGVAVRPDVKREPVSNWTDFGDFEIGYQLIELGEAYQPPDSATNGARERLRDYVVRVHRELEPGVTFLTRHPRGSHPLQLDFPEAKYAGAAACKDCHPKAYKVWSGSRHSHAYDSLIEYGKPFVKKDGKHIGRQFDPDCVKCHTTGFDYRGGFEDEVKTPHLKGNGCENCHGPASLHVARPNDPRYSLPLRLSIATVEDKCRHCHDGDNDPKFDLKTYWPKIQHGRE